MRMHAVMLEVVYYSNKFSWHKADGYSGGRVKPGKDLDRDETGKKGDSFSISQSAAKYTAFLSFTLKMWTMTLTLPGCYGKVKGHNAALAYGSQ